MWVKVDILLQRMSLMLRFFVVVVCVSVITYLYIYYDNATRRNIADVIVEGWGLNVSRSISRYVYPSNDTVQILNSQLCSSPLLLLIIVCSAVANVNERNTIRETWGNHSSLNVKVAFLLGIADNSTLQDSIEDEANLHNDIVQENFIDSYNNLTLKSVMLLKLISLHCQKVEYILKSDDDMFVHVPNLLSLVQMYHTKNIKKNVLIGELICEAKPIQDSNNKWYSPKYMYPGRVYPHYLSGTGYLMDSNTAVQLYKAALTTPFFHLEDVYITGLCARKADIKPRHNSGFSYLTRPLDPCLYIKNSNVFTSHRVTLENMKQLWSGLHNHTTCATLTPTTAPVRTRPHSKVPVIKKNYRCS